jgi:hypothetical protein
VEALGPFLEILIGGLLAGVLYSLVALGFVLIFKASGVFNFARSTSWSRTACPHGPPSCWGCCSRPW